MINLLPEKEKQNLLLRQIKNLILVLGSIVAASSICLILVLLLIKFYILDEVNEQKADFENIPKNPELENIRNAIENYNNVLPVVLSFYQKQTYFGDILDTIFSVKKSDGIKFLSASLDGQSDETKVVVKISGTSDTRENLTLLKKNLESNSLIKGVYFSPESWINPTGANFTFSLELSKNGY